MRPLYLISLAGLSRRLIADHGQRAPALMRLVGQGLLSTLIPPLPAASPATQATLLTGMLAADHGVSIDGDGLACAPFWTRWREIKPALSVCAALWDPAFRLDSPGWERSTFPAHHRNGERVMELLRTTAADVTAVRMAGIAHTALGDGPASDTVSRRLASLDSVMAALSERAQERDALVCVCGEFAVVPRRGCLAPDLAAATRVAAMGQVLHAWAEPQHHDRLAEKLRDTPGINHVWVDRERSMAGFSARSGGDIVALADEGFAFAASGPAPAPPAAGLGCAGGVHAHALDQPALIVAAPGSGGLGEDIKPRVGLAEVVWLLGRLRGSQPARDAVTG